MADNNAHLCHCGHEQVFHSSTNNECFITDCPCSEGFQPRWLAMSPKLRSALEQRDASTRTALREMNR